MGRALAVELATRHCDLAISDVDEVGLRTTADLAATAGAKVTRTIVDTSSRDQITSWAREVVRDHGRVNLIFNNAGVALSAPLATVKAADFEWIMSINFWGVVWGTQAFLPHLTASGDGHVVNTSSLFGLLAAPFNGPYNASKFAVRGYTEALRMELEYAGVPVSATCVHPGGVRTNIVRMARVDPGVSAATGVDSELARSRFDKLLDATTAEQAAQQILRAVRKNRRRVLVGNDAKALDKLVRLTGSWYQPLVLRGLTRQAKSR